MVQISWTMMMMMMMLLLLSRLTTSEASSVMVEAFALRSPPSGTPHDSRHSQQRTTDRPSAPRTTTTRTAARRAGHEFAGRAGWGRIQRRILSSSQDRGGPRGSVDSEDAGSPSLSPSLMLLSQHTHEFWSQSRSAHSIHEHVSSSLRSAARPNDDDNDNDNDNDDGTASMGARAPRSGSSLPTVDVLSTEPPLVLIHDFLSVEECEQIMEAATTGALNSLRRSTTGSSQVVGTGRTSSTAWLRDAECEGPLRRIASQVSALSGLPPSHMENLQVCRYLPGQEFKLHTDHQDSFNDLDCRGRLATCLVYLSSSDEFGNEGEGGGGSDATTSSSRSTSSSSTLLPTSGLHDNDNEDAPRGGETWFPGIRGRGDDQDVRQREEGVDDDDGVSVTPRRGSAVFFWNTMEKPGVKGYHPLMFLNTDARLRHAGLPVTRGEKWICNRWVHPVDFGAGVRGV